MKIRSISCWKENLDLTKPYTIAFKTVDNVVNCFISITLENGMIGFGSANPSKPVVGESIQDTEKVLNNTNLNWLIGQDIRFIHQLCYEVKRNYCKTPAAMAAIDIALHDAFTQYLGIPLVQYLGQKFKSLPTSITIGIKDASESLAEAKEHIESGFKILKVKLGKSLDEDIEVLAKLREKINPAIKIRIDANQGYTQEELKLFYKKTKSFNLELIEQPLGARAIDNMKTLPQEIKKLIAADESLLSAKNALELVSGTKACDIFNIKLMKCGGISEAKVISEIADNSNIDIMWGCNDESIISITAALHMAFACSNTKYIDLDGSLDLARDVVSGGFILKDGIMSISDKPGLGLKLI